MLRITCLVLMSLAFSLFFSTSYAVNDNASCGPGVSMASSTNAIITINITSSTIYAGATTSSTSGCEGPFVDSRSRANIQFTEMYVAQNYEQILEEVAQGQGAYLHAVASMVGCSEAAYGSFSEITKEVYTQLFPAHRTQQENKHALARHFMEKVRSYIATHPQLSQMCVTS